MFIGLNNAITGLTQDQLSKTINSLFSKNEQGTWYDPSDLSTLYQDAAGTTPVTAVEQPVGRMLDKSGRGNHATQVTTASRPVLSARVNLLTKTEQFNDAAWSKTNATIAANAVVAPDGTTTADTFIPGAGTVFGLAGGVYFNPLNYFSQGVSVAAATYKYRLRVKDAGYDIAQLRVSEGPTLAGTNQAQTKIILNTGVVNSQSSTGNLTNVTAACARTDDGWCDITLTFTSGAAQTLYFGIWAWNTTAITSDGVKGLHIWGADLRVANESANLPAYQRVNTSTDYDTAGFPMYLRFDGVDDFLQTNSINFTATDKMTVFAGVRKLSDAATATLFETSSSIINNNGTLFFGSPTSTNSYQFNSKGSSESIVGSGNGVYVAPITNVVAGISDISGDSVILRVNGNQVAQSTADQGTGNYGNYPLYIGRRGGTSLPFNGQLYGLVIRGALSSTGEIQGSESYMNLHTGAY